MRVSSASFPSSSVRHTVGTGTTEIYVSSIGSDTSGDGSAGFPYATVRRALVDVPAWNDTDVTIRVAAGSYAVPRVITDIYKTTIQGTVSVGGTGTISNVVSQSKPRGRVVDVTGFSLTADDLKGSIVKFTSGAAVDDYAVVYGNDATAAGVTRVYMTTDDSGALTNVNVTDTFDVQVLETILEFHDSAVIGSCHEFFFHDAVIESGGPGYSVITHQLTGRVEYRRCQVGEISRMICGTSAQMRFWTSYIGARGTTSFGILQGAEGSTYLRQGTVIDGTTCPNPNSAFLSVANGSLFWLGLVVFRATKFLKIDSANVAGASTSFNDDSFFFEDNPSLSNNCQGVQINALNGRGGRVRLPRLEGAVTSAYAVAAQSGAVVDFPASSGVTFAASQSSADGGTTRSKRQPDGTLIHYTGEQPADYDFIVVDTTKSPHNMVHGEYVLADTAAGAVNLLLPAFPRIGEIYLFRRLAAGFALTLDGNGKQVEVLTAPTTYAANSNWAGAGVSGGYIYDGTNWNIHY